MSIRTRIADALLGDERRKLQESTALLYRAYLDGPFVQSPEALLQQLAEVDSAYLLDMVNQLAYEQIGGLGGYSSAASEQERVRAVDESRRLYRYDVITQHSIRLWTDFGFGANIAVSPEDDGAQEVFAEFWTADRNASLLADDELQSLSEDLLVDGEKFLVYFISTIDGEATVRDIDTKEIAEFVADPNDSSQVLFYKRVWNDGKSVGQEAYYPDWRAEMSGALDALPADFLPRGAKRADLEKEGTTVVVQHIAHNRKGGQRGWPLMTAGAPWVRAHKQFRENRASVAAAIAMYVNKLKVKGGTRAVDAMQRKIQSALSSTNPIETNPGAAAGSTWLENDAANLERLPLSTGSSDAKTDGEALLLMAGLGAGLYPHYLGAGDSYRLATAFAMELPTKKQFARYQKFWTAQFRKMARIVLWAAEEYGGKTFESYTVDVSTDKLLDFDLTALGNLVNTVFNPNITSGLIPPAAAKASLAQVWRVILQAVGVSNADDLTSDAAFGIPATLDVKVAAELAALRETLQEAIRIAEQEPAIDQKELEKVVHEKLMNELGERA